MSSNHNLSTINTEVEFNHQHSIAEGAAGLLLHIINNDSKNGSFRHIPESVLNSALYSIDCAIIEMGKCFESLLRENMHAVQNMRDEESTRQIDIMELVAEFDEDHPQLRSDSIDAIKDGTTVESFQEHVLRLISRKAASC